MSYERKRKEKEILAKKLKTMKNNSYRGYYFDENLNRIIRGGYGRKRTLNAELKKSKRKMRNNKTVSKNGSYAKKKSGDAWFNFL